METFRNEAVCWPRSFGVLNATAVPLTAAKMTLLRYMFSHQEDDHAVLQEPSYGRRGTGVTVPQERCPQPAWG